eukprot:CAMPEP_0167751954 /NCGR_PEP_ID=MMETSP0110_2-20121227/6864_1 /TAXON_ID=629695 /ORGANISM="Gymnochlora sp., Strain CCMP2014" /LENGTH=487 /DNA_ID=CAMNT_0007637505 /DNA_START=247 /DNA_END=1710 /DNA_ORIENTATION=-
MRTFMCGKRPGHSDENPPPMPRRKTITKDFLALVASTGTILMLSAGVKGMENLKIIDPREKFRSQVEQLKIESFKIGDPREKFRSQVEQVIPFMRKSDQLTKLRKLQSTDSEMLNKLNQEISSKFGDDETLPLVETLKNNLEEEKIVTAKERENRDKLKTELQLNRISQVSLGLALLAFIVERQATKRAADRVAEEEQLKQEAGNATNIFFIPRISADTPREIEIKNRTFWDVVSNRPVITEKSSDLHASRAMPPQKIVDPHSKPDTLKDSEILGSESESWGWGWWRGVRGVFSKAKGTIKKKMKREKGGTTLTKIGDSERDRSDPSTIRVRILWKSAKTFWRWRNLSTVEVQIRGQLFLRLQALLDSLVLSTGLLQGVQEGLSNLITRNVARRLYANPVDQNVDYAYQVLRGPIQGVIIPLPKAKDLDIELPVPPVRDPPSRAIGTPRKTTFTRNPRASKSFSTKQLVDIAAAPPHKEGIVNSTDV